MRGKIKVHAFATFMTEKLLYVSIELTIAKEMLSIVIYFVFGRVSVCKARL